MWIFACGGYKEFGVWRADERLRKIAAISREYFSGDLNEIRIF